MFVSSNDFKTGINILLDGEIFTIIDFQHSKTARGPAFVRTKLRNLKTALVLEKTFRAGEKISRAYIEYKKMQYLYQSEEQLVVMDLETYDQLNLSAKLFKDGIKWLKEGIELEILSHEGNVIAAEIPLFVTLAITNTEPGFKGDTATGGTKPATLETGATIQVPLFVETDDVIQVDTRTGTYLKRA